MNIKLTSIILILATGNAGAFDDYDYMQEYNQRQQAYEREEQNQRLYQIERKQRYIESEIRRQNDHRLMEEIQGYESPYYPGLPW